jgi:hypothetical protein
MVAGLVIDMGYGHAKTVPNLDLIVGGARCLPRNAGFPDNILSRRLAGTPPPGWVRILVGTLESGTISVCTNTPRLESISLRTKPSLIGKHTIHVCTNRD